MDTSSRLPHRKALRLANFDYAEPQSYFVTIVARDRRCVFGRAEHDDIVPSPAGEMLVHEWRHLAARFGVEIKPFVVMPNHLHGLVSTCEMVDPPALGHVIGAFKSITAREYRAGAHACGWPNMPYGLWQRGYFDHVVRDEADEARIIDYINANPANWVTDPDNPDSPERTSDHKRLWRTNAGRHKGVPNATTPPRPSGSRTSRRIRRKP